MTNRIQSVIRMIGFESLSQQGLMFFFFRLDLGMFPADKAYTAATTTKINS